MSKSWDYADLSKLASQNGGPKKLVEKITRAGRLSMLPVVAVALVGGAALNHLYESKVKKSQKEADEAEKELIQRIQAYDATHQEDEKPNEPAQASIAG